MASHRPCVNSSGGERMCFAPVRTRGISGGSVTHPSGAHLLYFTSSAAASSLRISPISATLSALPMCGSFFSRETALFARPSSGLFFRVVADSKDALSAGAFYSIARFTDSPPLPPHTLSTSPPSFSLPFSLTRNLPRNGQKQARTRTCTQRHTDNRKH